MMMQPMNDRGDNDTTCSKIVAKVIVITAIALVLCVVAVGVYVLSTTLGG